MRRRLDEVAASTALQRSLRLLVLVSPLLAWLSAAASRHAPSSAFLIIALGLTSCWCAIAPGTRLGVVVPLLVAAPWWASTTARSDGAAGIAESASSGWLLIATMCLLLFHLSASAAAAIPSSAPMPLTALEPWLRRLVGLGGAAGLAWLVGAVVDRAGSASSLPAVTALGALPLLAVWAVWIAVGRSR